MTCVEIVPEKAYTIHLQTRDSNVVGIVLKTLVALIENHTTGRVFHPTNGVSSYK